MNRVSERLVAKALGGVVVRPNQVLAPGPGHSSKDRSLSVWIDPDVPDGFRVNSFAGDDWRDCRDHVRAALGIKSEGRVRQRALVAQSFAPQPDRTASARKIWDEAVRIGGTPVATYLTSRCLQFDQELDVGALRFHPSCPFRLDSGNTLRLPAMVAAMVDICDNAFRGIHRTALKSDGSRKAEIIGLGNPKRMLGPSAGACVKLFADEDVSLGIHIAEGIETALACMNRGFHPIWAALSAGGVERFPVLSGIDAITILADNDHTQTGLAAARACASRWVEAGREAIVLPWAEAGKDWADRPRSRT